MDSNTSNYGILGKSMVLFLDTWINMTPKCDNFLLLFDNYQLENYEIDTTRYVEFLAQ